MSLNYCTISNSSILSFCGNRRAIVLNQLLAVKYPQQTVGTSNQSLRKDTHSEVQRRWSDVHDEDVVHNFEQPFITVSVSMFGITKTQTIDRDQHLCFALVNNLSFSSSTLPAIIVNITNFKII